MNELVYEDFIGYSTGLYVRNNNEYVQMHALKVILHNGKKYKKFL